MTRLDVEGPSRLDANGRAVSPGVDVDVNDASDATDTTDALDAAALDQLARKRPDVFPNALYEVLFCSSLLVSMFMAVSMAL
jgi:hypothetical protein